MLRMQDVHAYYDLAPALKGVSLEVNEGEIVSVLGPNGAGKTTTVHAIMGVIKVKSGKIFLETGRSLGRNLIKSWDWESASFQRGDSSFRR